MRALVQRVTSARVETDGVVVGSIEHGVCVFIGVTHGDDEAIADRMVDRLAGFRMLADEDGRMNRSLRDRLVSAAEQSVNAVVAGAALLVVSQFTLYGSTSKGRRPGFSDAADPGRADELINRVVAGLRAEGFGVETGRFGADMQVSLTNDGPVTFLLEVD